MPLEAIAPAAPDAAVEPPEAADPMAARVAALEARVAELERRRPGLSLAARTALNGDRKWIPAAEFARLIGKPEVTVRWWCSQGKLPASKLGGSHWSINFRKLKATMIAGHRDMVISAAEFAAMARSA